MKLYVKLLNSDARLNSYEYIDQLVLSKGDTSALVFQLWDAEKGIRYIPQASVQVLSTTGATAINSNTITGLASVAGLVPGLAVTGNGIPAGTTVSSVGASSVILNQVATASASGVSLGFQTYGTTVLVSISRFPEYFPSLNNTRLTQDYSIARYAAPLFPADDRSVWYLPLTSQDTVNITSSGVLFTINEAASVKNVTVSYAIQASNLQEA